MTHDLPALVRREVDSAWIAGLLLLVAACCVYLAFWPGLIDWDTAQMLRQAQGGPIIDWWSGVGTLFLRGWLSARLSVGDLWALCVLANLVGFFGCARVALARVPAALVTLALTVFPPFYGQLASLSRDSAYVGATLVCFACLARLRDTDRRRRWLTLALGAGITAAVARQNGLVDVAIVVSVASIHGRPVARRRILAAGIGAVLAVAGVAGGIGLLQRETGVESTHAVRATYVYDLAAISTATGEDQFPQVALHRLGHGTASPANMTLRHLRTAFNPWTVNSLSGVEEMRIADPRLDAAENHVLALAWRRAVSEHPLAYLLERARLSALMLGLGGSPQTSSPEIVNYGGLASPTNFGHPLAHLSAFLAATRYLDTFIGRHPRVPLNRGWVYLLVISAAMLFAARRRPALRSAAIGLLLIVWLNQGLLFFAAPGASFRYIVLLAPVTVLSLTYAAVSCRTASVTRSRPQMSLIPSIVHRSATRAA